MKGPKELKNYISRYRKELNAGHWDDMLVFKLQDKCKKWYKRTKQINPTEFDS